MSWNKIVQVVDCYAEGESGQVIDGGVGDAPGETVLDKRRHLQDQGDEL